LCRPFETPAPPAIRSAQEFQMESVTRIPNLLVPMTFRSL
jgi:hypothetical protein